VKQTSSPDGFLRYLLEAGSTHELAVRLVRAYQRDRWRLSPRRRLGAVDRVPLDRPLFLLGTQGSGGTLVGRCLRRNPTVVTVSGGWRQWTGTDEIGIVPSRMRRLPPSLWGSSHRSDIADPLLGTRHASAFACAELLPRYRATATDARPDDGDRFTRLLREHISVYADDPARARFLDKTHAYTVKLPLLASILERFRPVFLLVLRNPFSTCTWAVDRKPPSFQSPLSYEERLQLIADHWANAHRLALEDAATVPGIAVVRFEDFLAGPEKVVRAVCEFAELDFDPGMVPGPGQRLPWATLAGDRKWYPLYGDDRLARVTAESAAVIEARCGELAARFGYSAQGAESRSDPLEVLSARV
jgi:Sulfotransferase family